MKRILRYLRLRVTDTRPNLRLYAGYSEESLRGRKFYNVGAGAFSHPYWTNIDHATKHYRDAQHNRFTEHDLTTQKPLPIESGAAEAIYFSHVLEHVPDAAATCAIEEAYRILKPGGTIRITGPDMDLHYAALRRGDEEFYAMSRSYLPPDATLPQRFLHELATMLVGQLSDEEILSRLEEYGYEYFTSRCRYDEENPGYHVNWWTTEKALSRLSKAGFTSPRASAYGQSWCPPFRDINHFDTTHPKVSFYVEAQR